MTQGPGLTCTEWAESWRLEAKASSYEPYAFSVCLIEAKVAAGS